MVVVESSVLGKIYQELHVNHGYGDRCLIISSSEAASGYRLIFHPIVRLCLDSVGGKEGGCSRLYRMTKLNKALEVILRPERCL